MTTDYEERLRYEKAFNELRNAAIECINSCTFDRQVHELNKKVYEIERSLEKCADDWLKD